MSADKCTRTKVAIAVSENPKDVSLWFVTWECGCRLDRKGLAACGKEAKS